MRIIGQDALIICEYVLSLLRFRNLNSLLSTKKQKQEPAMLPVLVVCTGSLKSSHRLTGGGRIVADFLYDNIFLEEYYSMWRFIVRKGDKYGFIYYNGDYIEPAYEEIAFSEEDRFYHVKQDGRWGYVDKGKSFRSADEQDEICSNDFYGSVF
jgi:hypothetical protein